MAHRDSKEGNQFPFEKRSREQVRDLFKRTPGFLEEFQSLTEEFQEELMGFAMGNRGLKICYDPFFKMIFDPEIHRERLSQMLSCMMGEKVSVKWALPSESSRVTAEGSLLIMDILTELENGELVNVEIQKVGYAFPGERAACYSSDLMLRQYNRVKNRKKKCFSYKDLRSVYTIVLVEKSGAEFHDIPESYLHRSRQIFDTGLKMDLLQKYIFISLDVFLEMAYTVDNELEAWLLFLSSDKIEDIIRIIQKYPFFKELYREIAEFQTKPEELIGMYSKALEILDKNTVQYMIDEQKQEIERQTKYLKEQAALLKAKEQELYLRDLELQEKNLLLQETDSQLKETDSQLKETNSQLKETNSQLKETNSQLKESNSQLQVKDAEIKRLKMMLNSK